MKDMEWAQQQWVTSGEMLCCELEEAPSCPCNCNSLELCGSLWCLDYMVFLSDI
jgi:hypothetical protein